jgi:hypothetical protein
MYLRADRSASSRVAAQTQKSVIIITGAGTPWYVLCSARLRWIAGRRIGQGRSENITMCAPSRAAESTESSLEATA